MTFSCLVLVLVWDLLNICRNISDGVRASQGTLFYDVGLLYAVRGVCVNVERQIEAFVHVLVFPYCGTPKRKSSISFGSIFGRIVLQDFRNSSYFICMS